LASFNALWGARGEKYPALLPVSIGGYEAKNIEKAFDVLTDEEADLLFQQMSYFAELTYDCLLDVYGEASYKGAPFYAYIGYNQLPVYGRMKLYQNTAWVLYDLKIETKREEKQDPASSVEDDDNLSDVPTVDNPVSEVYIPEDYPPEYYEKHEDS